MTIFITLDNVPQDFSVDIFWDKGIICMNVLEFSTQFFKDEIGRKPPNSDVVLPIILMEARFCHCRSRGKGHFIDFCQRQILHPESFWMDLSVTNTFALK